ncbi:hypothetical protein BaRGS_00021425 [Batillaria attramentaria]|uniref:Protein FAM167A n=1 Tax=Batillaria attramentaria TaxID=370345 RepID=A0ABD0KJQ7_9CAEN
MGGKRELRRCMSMLDAPEQVSDELRNRAATLINHVTTVCPVTIQIDECSDDESRDFNKSTENGDVSKSGRKHQEQNNNYGWPVRLSPTLPRRSSPNFLEAPENCDLSHVKATAIRLNLRTRRSSFLEWQAACARAPPQLPPSDDIKDRLTSERKERINDALDWLKTELTEMRSMDQHLARQLLSLRHDIHQLRLRRSCQLHRDLLDDVQSEFEEQEELSDVLDLPNSMLSDTPLKQLGVTRMNISARRFSTC